MATALKAFKLDGKYDGMQTFFWYRNESLQRQINIDYEEDLRANKNLGIYKGALFENFIAEAFVKQGVGLYYYKKSFWCAKIEKIKKKVNGKWN